MSEHEEYIPLSTETERRCIKCVVILNPVRDGTTNSNNCCHNCYWREQNMQAQHDDDIVPFICYHCEKTFNSLTGISNYCHDCLV